jgi:hypothetical protein
VNPFLPATYFFYKIILTNQLNYYHNFLFLFQCRMGALATLTALLDGTKTYLAAAEDR